MFGAVPGTERPLVNSHHDLPDGRLADGPQAVQDSPEPPDQPPGVCRAHGTTAVIHVIELGPQQRGLSAPGWPEPPSVKVKSTGLQGASLGPPAEMKQALSVVEKRHTFAVCLNLSRPPIKYPSTSSLPGKWPSSYTVRKSERNKPVSRNTKNALGIATASSVQSSYAEKFYIAAVSFLFSVQLERVTLWLMTSHIPLRTGSQHLHSLTQPSTDFPTGLFRVSSDPRLGSETRGAFAVPYMDSEKQRIFSYNRRKRRLLQIN